MDDIVDVSCVLNALKRRTVVGSENAYTFGHLHNEISGFAVKRSWLETIREAVAYCVDTNFSGRGSNIHNHLLIRLIEVESERFHSNRSDSLHDVNPKLTLMRGMYAGWPSFGGNVYQPIRFDVRDEYAFTTDDQYMAECYNLCAFLMSLIDRMLHNTEISRDNDGSDFW